LAKNSSKISSTDTLLKDLSVFIKVIEKLKQPKQILIYAYLVFKSWREAFTYVDVKTHYIVCSGKYINAQFKRQFYNHVKREFFKLVEDDNYTMTEKW